MGHTASEAPISLYIQIHTDGEFVAHLAWLDEHAVADLTSFFDAT